MKIKSEKLLKILKDREAVNKEIKAIHNTLAEADRTHKKLQAKVQKLKDKGAKILDSEMKKLGGLKEFEYFTDYKIDEDGTIDAKVCDVFNDAFGDPEGVKNRLRKDKKEGKGMWADELMYIGHNK